jgi:hypothetical protein
LRNCPRLRRHQIPEATPSSEDKREPSIARILVGITLVLWLVVFYLAKTVARDWHLALLPLYGLYPGHGASGESNPTLMHSWAIGMGAVFATLAWMGIARKNKSAAAVFFFLLILSSIVGFVRLLAAVASIH